MTKQHVITFCTLLDIFIIFICDTAFYS